jgi:hypothetical protein
VASREELVSARETEIRRKENELNLREAKLAAKENELDRAGPQADSWAFRQSPSSANLGSESPSFGSPARPVPAALRPSTSDSNLPSRAKEYAAKILQDRKERERKSPLRREPTYLKYSPRADTRSPKPSGKENA